MGSFFSPKRRQLIGVITILGDDLVLSIKTELELPAGRPSQVSSMLDTKTAGPMIGLDPSSLNIA
jgi:hypothetical protein